MFQLDKHFRYSIMEKFMSKRLQYIQETISADTEKTGYSTSFLQNYQTIETLDKVLTGTKQQFANLLQPTTSGKNAQFSTSQMSKLSSIITGGPLNPHNNNADWRQPQTVLASFLAEQAGELDNFMDNCTFSLALMDAGKCFQYIGEARNDLGKVTNYEVKSKRLNPNVRNPNVKKTKAISTNILNKKLTINIYFFRNALCPLRCVPPPLY